MIPSGCGRHCNWPTQSPIPSSLYPLSGLRRSCSIIPADEIQAEKFWLQLLGKISLAWQKEKLSCCGLSCTILFPSCFLEYQCDVWRGSSHPRTLRRATMWGWHRKIRGSWALEGIIHRLPSPGLVASGPHIWEKNKPRSFEDKKKKKEKKIIHIILCSTLCWACSLCLRSIQMFNNHSLQGGDSLILSCFSAVSFTLVPTNRSWACDAR